ncbi:MAG: hypothetical protein ACYCT2_04100 [Thermoplasmataceae archaeon]
MRYLIDTDVKLICVKSLDGPVSADKTFDDLERKLPSLKGRKFYGMSKLEGDNLTYFACVKVQGEDDANKREFQEIVLPKGEYEREVIINWEEHIDQISEQFEKIESKNIVDPQRFFVEYYRSRKELILMVPIK